MTQASPRPHADAAFAQTAIEVYETELARDRARFYETAARLRPEVPARFEPTRRAASRRAVVRGPCLPAGAPGVPARGGRTVSRRPRRAAGAVRAPARAGRAQPPHRLRPPGLASPRRGGRDPPSLLARRRGNRPRGRPCGGGVPRREAGRRGEGGRHAGRARSHEDGDGGPSPFRRPGAPPSRHGEHPGGAGGAAAAARCRSRGRRACARTHRVLELGRLLSRHAVASGAGQPRSDQAARARLRLRSRGDENARLGVHEALPGGAGKTRTGAGSRTRSWGSLPTSPPCSAARPPLKRTRSWDRRAPASTS